MCIRDRSPTEAGQHLLAVVAPRLEEIDNELMLLSAFRDKPAGKLRITAGAVSYTHLDVYKRQEP